MSVSRSRGSPWRRVATFAREALREGIRDRLVHEDARARQAHLPSVVVLLDREIDREIEIGVAEHDAR